LARPLPEPVLFLDECLGSTDVPRVLREKGIRVEFMRDHFGLSTPDADWLREVGRRGWVVLTKDQRIRRRQAEFQALLEAVVLEDGVGRAGARIAGRAGQRRADQPLEAVFAGVGGHRPSLLLAIKYPSSAARWLECPSSNQQAIRLGCNPLISKRL
jgi:hypothetical protein